MKLSLMQIFNDGRPVQSGRGWPASRIIPHYIYSVPSFIIGELENIKERSRGKTRTAAITALKIASLPPLKVRTFPSLKVKELMMPCSVSPVLCTNDRNLEKEPVNEIYLSYTSARGNTLRWMGICDV